MHQNTSSPDPLAAVWGLRLRGGREVVRGEAREPASKERAERGGATSMGNGMEGREDGKTGGGNSGIEVKVSRMKQWL